jgi:uncharacterized protein (TIGR03382 family)
LLDIPMKRPRVGFVVVIAVAVLCGTASAEIVNISHYPLGEPGSVSGSQPYTPLVDVIGGTNIPNWNTSATKTSLTSTGLVAPGSTAAAVISDNAGTAGTWYGSSFISGTGLTDNWAFDIYLRPDTSSGTFLGATDGNGASATGLRFWATNSSQAGTSLGGKTLSSGTPYLLLSNGSGFLGASSSTYTPGTWVRLTAIRHDETVYYYLDEQLQDQASTAGFVNDIRLGAGYNAAAGSNGAFDELRIYTFDATDPIETVAATVFAVPEPAVSAAAPLGVVLAGWLLRRRRR